MNTDDLKFQDSAYIGNIAASNPIWVETYGTRRKKGNVTKSTFLHNIAPIDYNEGSKIEDEEEDIGSDEELFDFQSHSNIPTSSYKKDQKPTPNDILLPSCLLLPSLNPQQNGKLNLRLLQKERKRGKYWNLMTRNLTIAFYWGTKERNKWMTWI
jgi:hypothetical protein